MPHPKFTNHFLILQSNAQVSVLNLLELPVTHNIIDYYLFLRSFPSFSSLPFASLFPISLITSFQSFSFSVRLKHRKFISFHP